MLTEENLQKSYDKKEWQRGYTSQPHEYEYQIEEIEGEIPLNLAGTLFRNGPGLLDIHGTPIHHPFDGDGMIASIALQDGKAFFRNRYVRTEAYQQEREAGKILYRGVFGTQKPGGWLNNAFDLRLKNIANTNVIYWGGKLLALWEAAEPYRLDPATLETIGIDYLDGVLQKGDAFSAHPRIDPCCDLDGGAPCLVNFSLKAGLSSNITIQEFNPDGKLLRSHTHAIAGFTFVHDFLITPNYCIFFQSAINFNPLPYLLGWKGAGECLNFLTNKPTRVVLIPRKPPYGEVKVLEVDAGFAFHHVNAFEGDGKIYADSIAYSAIPQINPDVSYKEIDFENLAPGLLYRFTLDLATGKVEKQLIDDRCVEFPTINPQNVGRDYRYTFIGAAHKDRGNAPLQSIFKLDWHTGERQIHSFAPTGFVGEPIFVAKPDATEEDDGWVLTLIYDGAKHRSSLVILDGKNIDRGAVAKLHLKQHIPYGLHGCWTNEVFAPR
jgi:all-trans-8'-apo-beta-carotenal 15,15'-oxygenase